MSTSLLVLLALQGSVAPIHMQAPEVPPLLAADASVRAAIDTARACVANEGDSRFDADRATRAVRQPIGSVEWESARVIVVKYAKKRDASRACILQLDQFGATHTMSQSDRKILATHAKGLLSFWDGQNVYQVQIMARMLGADVGAATPAWLR